MNKERKVIEPNAIIVFDRDVKSSELSALPKDFQGDIVINGDLIFEENYLSIKCDSLHVKNIIEVNCNVISIIGDLYVEGDCNIYDIKVNGSIYCFGKIDSGLIDVAEDIFVKEGIDTNSYSINVGGELVCKSSIKSAWDIVVLKKLDVKGSIDAQEIHIG